MCKSGKRSSSSTPPLEGSTAKTCFRRSIGWKAKKRHRAPAVTRRKMQS